MMFRRVGMIALAIVVLPTIRPALAGYNVYVALGDSLAFGEYRFQSNPSNGDRGYVAPFADSLAKDYGTRPTVINLGVDGETSTTFVQGAPPGDGSSGHPGYSLNTNYSAPYSMSQNQMLLSTLMAQPLAGGNVGVVTVQLGANDLFVLVGSSSFQSMTPAQQQAAIVATINTIATNDAMILTELKSLAPRATVIMMGYYDPFAPFFSDSSSPLYPIAQFSHLAIPGLNQAIGSVASGFGDKFVNPYNAFAGKELIYTDVANNGNVHPTTQGYAVIGALLSVPEPPSVISLGLGGLLVGGGWLVRRRRQVST